MNTSIQLINNPTSHEMIDILRPRWSCLHQANKGHHCILRLIAVITRLICVLAVFPFAVTASQNEYLCHLADINDWVDCCESKATIVKRSLLNQKSTAHNFMEGKLTLKLRVSYSTGSDAFSEIAPLSDCAKLTVTVRIGTRNKTYEHITGVTDYIEDTVPYIFVPPFRESDIYIESTACKTLKVFQVEGRCQYKPQKALGETVEGSPQDGRPAKAKEDSQVRQQKNIKVESHSQESRVDSASQSHSQESRVDSASQSYSQESRVDSASQSRKRDLIGSMAAGHSQVQRSMEQSDGLDRQRQNEKNLPLAQSALQQSGENLVKSLSQILAREQFDSGGASSGGASLKCQKLASQITDNLSRGSRSNFGGRCDAAREMLRVLTYAKNNLSRHACYGGEYDQSIAEYKSYITRYC